MDLLFLGSSDFSVPFLESLYCSHNNITTVITNPDMPQGRGKKFLPNPVKIKAIELGLNVLEAKQIEEKEINFLSGEKFDGAVIVSCGIILPSSFLSLIPHRCINVHPSLLPKYRGPSPITGALRNGDSVTGISIMEVTEQVDAGPIFSQTKIKIHPNDNKDRLKSNLSTVGCYILEATLKLIENDMLQPYLQDQSQATYTCRWHKDDLRIDWENNAEHIHNQIRAFSSYPGCYCYLDKKRVKVLETEIFKPNLSPKVGPGTVISIDKEKGITVQCGEDTAILLQFLQPENKKPMDFKDFLNGYRINIGDRFA